MKLAPQKFSSLLHMRETTAQFKTYHRSYIKDIFTCILKIDMHNHPLVRREKEGNRREEKERILIPTTLDL